MISLHFGLACFVMRGFLSSFGFGGFVIVLRDYFLSAPAALTLGMGFPCELYVSSSESDSTNSLPSACPWRLLAAAERLLRMLGAGSMPASI